MAALLSACGADVEPPAAPPDGGSAAPSDAGPIVPHDAGVLPRPDAGAAAETLRIGGGDVSGRWCGAVEIAGSITVPAGQTLTICGGSTIDLLAATPRVRVTVQGTLRVEGTAGSPVWFEGAELWDGIKVGGRLEGTGLELRGAAIGVDGLAGSSIELEHLRVIGAQRGMQLENGGTFRRTTIEGGSTITITGGVLRMSDSVIDLGRPLNGPDCTDWAGGGAELEHVRFTGCHCPIHINRASEPVSITGSIFDGASVPVMIARSNAVFHGNHFISTGPEFLDIGGAIQADVSGNYWGGNAPRITSGNMAQFTGTGDYSRTPIPGVGPRP